VPLLLTTPEVTQTNTVRIESFYINRINDPSGPALIVNISRGNTVEGVYTPTKWESLSLGGDVVTTAIAQAPQGASLYAAVKTALYALMQQEGLVGGGSLG